MAAIIDLRSDTVTQPTDAMRRAMATAEVGDDVYGEDPTVRRLQELAADMLGKEAALFVSSGTQGNQVAIATHAAKGEEVICEADAHVFYYEAAAASAIAGVQLRPLTGFRGALGADDVAAAIREPDVHDPRTALVCVENTHNRAGGTVVPLASLRAVRAVATAAGVPIHMDGARLFNAAVATGVPVREIAATADSIQICLSKGLSAPVGSLLVGTRSFISAALQWRKRLGGGMRQAGVIAAPGLLALTEMVDRLAEDHQNAALLAHQLAEIDQFVIALDTVQTNIVIADMANLGIPLAELLALLQAEGVLATSFGGSRIRFVTHRGISREDTLQAADVVARVSKRVCATAVK